jgi:hypothetical protein
LPAGDGSGTARVGIHSCRARAMLGSRPTGLVPLASFAAMAGGGSNSTHGLPDVLRSNSKQDCRPCRLRGARRKQEAHTDCAKEFSHALRAGCSHLLIPSLLRCASTGAGEGAGRQYGAMQGRNLFESRQEVRCMRRASGRQDVVWTSGSADPVSRGDRDRRCACDGRAVQDPGDTGKPGKARATRDAEKIASPQIQRFDLTASPAPSAMRWHATP